MTTAEKRRMILEKLRYALLPGDVYIRYDELWIINMDAKLIACVHMDLGSYGDYLRVWVSYHSFYHHIDIGKRNLPVFSNTLEYIQCEFKKGYPLLNRIYDSPDEDCRRQAEQILIWMNRDLIPLLRNIKTYEDCFSVADMLDRKGMTFFISPERVWDYLYMRGKEGVRQYSEFVRARKQNDPTFCDHMIKLEQQILHNTDAENQAVLIAKREASEAICRRLLKRFQNEKDSVFQNSKDERCE